MIEYGYEYFNSRGVEFCGREAGHTGDSELSKNYFASASVYQDYETSDPSFDKRNLDAVFGVACPKIDQAMTHLFIDFGQASKWGKQKDKVPSVDRWFDSELANIARSATNVLERLSAGSRGRIHKFGLDIHGPGGGQWQFTAGKEGEFVVSPGLPDASYPVLTMDDQQVSQLLAAAGQAKSNSHGRACPSSIWLDPIQSVLELPAG